MTTLDAALNELLVDPLRKLPRDGSVLAWVGPAMPEDLLAATRRPVVHLPWRTGFETPQASAWIESGFPRWAHSMLEDWASGRFDDIGDVVFSRGGDAGQRLYYYVCELQRSGRLRGPRPWLCDVALIPRELSLRHTAQALRTLGAALGVDEPALRAGIDETNARRGRLAELGAARVDQGPLHEKLLRADLFTDLRSVWSGGVPPVTGAARRRVLLAGSAPPDARLHEAVEQGGASVIAEWHDRAPCRLGDTIDAGDEPWLALARQAHAQVVGPRSHGDAAAALLAAAKAARAEAVVLWLAREDEALAWRVPAQRAALAQAGLPALVLPASQGEGADGAPEAITRFIEGLSS